MAKAHRGSASRIKGRHHMTTRSHGDGGIDQRGPDIWRLRYRVDGRRVTQTVRAPTKRDAQKELRRLLRSTDTGTAALPSRITLGQWAVQWLAMGAPSRK